MPRPTSSAADGTRDPPPPPQAGTGMACVPLYDGLPGGPSKPHSTRLPSCSRLLRYDVNARPREAKGPRLLPLLLVSAAQSLPLLLRRRSTSLSSLPASSPPGPCAPSGVAAARRPNLPVKGPAAAPAASTSPPGCAARPVSAARCGTTCAGPGCSTSKHPGLGCSSCRCCCDWEASSSSAASAG